MLRWLNKKKKKNILKGFSTIEIVIGVTIMSIMAGIVTPMFLTGKESAMLSRTQKELELISMAARDYYMKYDTFDEDLTLVKLNQLRFLNIVPKDPWNNDYFLGIKWIPVSEEDSTPDSGTVAFVASSGPDGIFQISTDKSSASFNGVVPSDSDDLIMIVMKIE